MQIDLVVNWKQMCNDHICRHVRITNYDGTQAFAAINNIQPALMNGTFTELG